MNPIAALDWLEHFGYVRPEIAAVIRAFPATLANFFKPLLMHFQAVADLPATGDLDQSTVDAMLAPRCGCRDVMHVTSADALPVRWRKTSLTYAMHNYGSVLPQSVQDGVIDDAFGKMSWSKDVEIDFTRIHAGQQADINIYWQRIDGPGNILAQCYLPDGRDSPIRMEIDSGENKWGLIVGSPEANLLGTVTHELGHGIGEVHLTDRDALMFAYANSNIVRPTPKDLAAAYALGYAKRVASTPTTPTPAGKATKAMLPESIAVALAIEAADGKQIYRADARKAVN